MERARKTEDRRLLLFVLAAGVALRLVWLLHVHGGLAAFVERGEATLEAVAFAQGRGFADAYFPGYGPSAHLLPGMPAFTGTLLWLFGTGPAGALATLAWSLAQVLCGWLLLHRLFSRLGSDPRALRLGMILLALLPVFAPQETVDFRWWEGAAAVCFACLNLLLLLDFEDRAPSMRGLALAAALWAVTCFLSPPTGLATAGAWAWHALRRLPLPRAVAFAGMSAGALALLVLPWAIRNAQQLGEPVPMRSNIGLELALANHPAALSGTAPADTMRERLRQIHPYHSAQARAALAHAGGEIAYSRALGAETRRWIAAHPASFAWLSLRHLSEYFFPRPWQMQFSGWDEMQAPRAITIGLVSLLGLVALVIGLRQRRRGFVPLALVIGLTALPYAVTQPIPRYSFLDYGLLVFLAAGLAAPAPTGPGWAR